MNLLFLQEQPILIFPGTWLEQPAWWLDAIAILKTERSAQIQRKPNGS
jgi:hypothetical protein